SQNDPVNTRGLAEQAIAAAKQQHAGGRSQGGEGERPGETMQAKLAMSTPGDVYEAEADAIAERIVAMPPSPSAERSSRPLDAGARARAEPGFGHDFSRVRIHSAQTSLRAKLEAGSPDDPAERNADAVAGCGCIMRQTIPGPTPTQTPSPAARPAS